MTPHEGPALGLRPSSINAIIKWTLKVKFLFTGRLVVGSLLKTLDVIGGSYARKLAFEATRKFS